MRIVETVKDILFFGTVAFVLLAWASIVLGADTEEEARKADFLGPLLGYQSDYKHAIDKKVSLGIVRGSSYTEEQDDVGAVDDGKGGPGDEGPGDGGPGGKD